MSDQLRGVIPSSHLDILDKAGLAHIATIGPKGEPQTSPVWFDWDGEHLAFSNLKTRQKYRNLTARPEVAVSLVDPDNLYRYLEIRGRVIAIEDDPDYAFINKMAKKYLGQDVYPNTQPGDERVIIVIEPQHSTSMP